MSNQTKIKGREARPPLSKKAKRLLIAGIALLLALLLVGGGFLLFRPKKAVFTYYGVPLTLEMYHFWFSSLKTDYMVTYGLKSDSEATWQAPCTVAGEEGKTWGEFLTERIDEAIKAKLIAGVLFDRMGVTMGSADRAKISEYLEGEYEYATGGDREAFALLLEKYHTNDDALRQCAILELKAELLYSYLYGNDGQSMTVGEKEDYFKAHYKRVKILYLNEEKKVVLKDGGGTEEKPLGFEDWTFSTNAENELSPLIGEGSTLTEARFDELIQSSHEPLHAIYEGGVYIYDKATADTNFTNMIGGEAVEKAAKEVKVGELRRVETADGVRYVFGYALDYAPYLKSMNADFFTDFLPDAAGDALNGRVKAELSAVTVNQENYGKRVPIQALPYNPDEIKRYSVD